MGAASGLAALSAASGGQISGHYEEKQHGLLTYFLIRGLQGEADANGDRDILLRCEKMLQLLLGFSERNPGITRVLLGDVLVGENDRLQARVAQFFERLETQFRQVLREANLETGAPRTAGSIEATANQLVAFAEGKMCQYVRSSFTKLPTAHWNDQWQCMKTGLFR